MHHTLFLFFFLMIRRPPRSTLFPTRRSSDLECVSIRERNKRKAKSKTPHQNARFRTRGRNESAWGIRDRKSTRLNSSHSQISYAVFCLKKKKKKKKKVNYQHVKNKTNIQTAY